MSGSNLPIAWAKLFLRSLARAGATKLVLSPGSRSTPLAVAACEEPLLDVTVVVDERAASFFALGQARITGRPSVLVCTSGTAVAHYFPALIEAHQSGIPLIAVTADRPWELYDCGAPQTIDQVKLFGDFVRHFAELGVPDPEPSALRAVPRIAAQAVSMSLSPRPGPVHINARFRKPLDPVLNPAPEPWTDLVTSLMERDATQFHVAPPLPSRGALDATLELLGRAERGLIVCGPAPLSTPEGQGAVLELARRTGFPLLPEATSQLRFGGDRTNVVCCGSLDFVLGNARFRSSHRPDVILELSAPPTSAGYAELIREAPEALRVVVSNSPFADPQGTAAHLVVADPGVVCSLLVDRLPTRASGPSPWSRAFSQAAEKVDACVRLALEGAPLGHATVARGVVDACPEGSILVVGNSTPVRDLDAYCPPSSRSLRVIHQRGASGIDGLVAGAAGASRAEGGPVILLLGDLSLFHDIGALRLVADAVAPLVIVVVQNGGGRIFEQLPIVKRTSAELFERCFATPQAVDFEHAALAFGVSFARATSRDELRRALEAAFDRKGGTLIEAVVPPHDGASFAAKIRAEIEQRGLE